MKIAYIYDVIYPYVKGGAEKRFWELAKRLSSNGHQVHIFGMKSWDGDSCLEKDGVFIHGISKHRRLYLDTGLRSMKQVFCFTINILPALWKEKFDIIDCNAFPYLPFFSVKLLSFLKKIPLVITWQEIWDKYWYRYLGYLKGFIARLIERIVIMSSNNIIILSLKYKKELLRFGVSEKNNNIRIIPPGVDLKIIQGTLPALENTDLIFVGRLIKDKNVDILIKAVLLVKNERSGNSPASHLNNIKCIIIGEGPEKDKLVSLVAKLDLSNNIIFKDFMQYEELISLMKASKIFVFPSTREGFGIVVIEAMACGLPVITTDHSMNAACELISDGENGFICQLDEKELAAKILMLLDDSSLRNNMVGKAKEFAKEYDWDIITKENEEFYNYVSNKH